MYSSCRTPRAFSLLMCPVNPHNMGVGVFDYPLKNFLQDLCSKRYILGNASANLCWPSKVRFFMVNLYTSILIHGMVIQSSILRGQTKSSCARQLQDWFFSSVTVRIENIYRDQKSKSRKPILSYFPTLRPGNSEIIFNTSSGVWEPSVNSEGDLLLFLLHLWALVSHSAVQFCFPYSGFWGLLFSCHPLPLWSHVGNSTQKYMGTRVLLKSFLEDSRLNLEHHGKHWRRTNSLS